MCNCDGSMYGIPIFVYHHPIGADELSKCITCKATYAGQEAYFLGKIADMAQEFDDSKVRYDADRAARGGGGAGGAGPALGPHMPTANEMKSAPWKLAYNAVHGSSNGSIFTFVADYILADFDEDIWQTYADLGDDPSKEFIFKLSEKYAKCNPKTAAKAQLVETFTNVNYTLDDKYHYLNSIIIGDENLPNTNP